MHFPSPWTDERCDKLRNLWAEGVSCSQIAADLGGGISRNGVIGKVHRLGLGGHAKKAYAPRAKPARPIQRNKMTRYVAPPRTNAEREQEAEFERALDMNTVADADIPIKQRKTLAELNDDHCRWPVGDPGTPAFFFCGATPRPEKPYCAAHCARAYASNPMPRRVYPFTENSV